MNKLAGDVDPDDYVECDKDIASSMPAVDADSISRCQEVLKEIIEKHGNPADEIMDVSSNENVDEEIEDPQSIKSTSDVLQVMDKVILCSYQFNSGELCESILKVIRSLQDLQILRRRQKKITAFVTKKQIAM